MSAVPGNILSFSDFGGSGNDPSVMGWGDTQSTDYSTNPIGYGVPDNTVNAPRSDGVTWTGVLGGVESTANNLLNTFSKVYQLQSTVENAKFNQTIQASQLDLQRSQALGSLEVQRANVDASKTIALAQAKRQTADAISRTETGSTFISKVNTPYLMIAGVIGIAAVVYFMGVKK